MTEYLTQNEMWVHSTRLREAEARIAELESASAKGCAQLDAARLCAEALATVEWFDNGDDVWFCAWCTMNKEYGHTSGCQRQAAQRAASESGLLNSPSVKSVESVSSELTAARRVVEVLEAHLSDRGPWSQLSDAIAAYRAAYPREE